METYSSRVRSIRSVSSPPSLSMLRLYSASQGVDQTHSGAGSRLGVIIFSSGFFVFMGLLPARDWTKQDAQFVHFGTLCTCAKVGKGIVKLTLSRCLGLGVGYGRFQARLTTADNIPSGVGSQRAAVWAAAFFAGIRSRRWRLSALTMRGAHGCWRLNSATVDPPRLLMKNLMHCDSVATGQPFRTSVMTLLKSDRK